MMQITENLFVAYCHCAYKAFLKSKGEVGEFAEYEVIQKEAPRQVQGPGDRSADAKPH